MLSVQQGMGQPTFSTGNLPQAGQVFTWHSVDTVGLQPGPAGPNQTWDFSSAQKQSETSVIEWVNPEETPYASQYPTATLCEKSDTAWSYFRLDNNRWTRIGESSEAFSSGPWTDPLDMASVPWVYGETMTDNAATTFESAGQEIHRTVQIQGLYDGYGTLILPGGTYSNVMRFKYRQVSRDSSAVTFGPVTIPTVVVVDIRAYVWMREGESQLLFNLDSTTVTITVGGPVPSTQIQTFTSAQMYDPGTSTGMPPELLMPENNGFATGPNVTLSWRRELESDRVRVQVSPNASFDPLVADTAVVDDSVTIQGLELGVVYYWRALTARTSAIEEKSVANVQSESEWSETREFTTRPPAPKGESPADLTSHDAPMVTFQWVTDQPTSRLQLSNVPAFEEILQDETVSGTTKDLEILTPGVYYWRVAAITPTNVQSEWSQVIGFQVVVSSVKEASETNIVAGPLPAISTILVTLDESYPVDRMVIISATGEQCAEIPVSQSETNVAVHVSHLPAGTYSLVMFGKTTIRLPIVVVR